MKLLASLFSLGVSALILIACASVEHVYPGEARASDEIAVLRASRGMVVEVDGQSVFAKHVALLPGIHELVVHFILSGEDLGRLVGEEYRAKLVCGVRFRASAGHSYRIRRIGPQQGSERGIITRYHHHAILTNDALDDPVARIEDCWWE